MKNIREDIQTVLLRSLKDKIVYDLSINNLDLDLGIQLDDLLDDPLHFRIFRSLSSEMRSIIR